MNSMLHVRRALRAIRTAVSSIWLLVTFEDTPPAAHECRSIKKHHPPGPGFPNDEPSAATRLVSTVLCITGPEAEAGIFRDTWPSFLV